MVHFVSPPPSPLVRILENCRVFFPCQKYTKKVIQHSIWDLGGGEGHYDKEHITLNESPTPGSVDQGL
jgi:hypothetical protein